MRELAESTREFRWSPPPMLNSTFPRRCRVQTLVIGNNYTRILGDCISDCNGSPQTLAHNGSVRPAAGAAFGMTVCPGGVDCTEIQSIQSWQILWVETRLWIDPNQQGFAQGLVCLVETRLGIDCNQAGIGKPVVIMPGIPTGILPQRQCIPGVDQAHQAGIWGCAQPCTVAHRRSKFGPKMPIVRAGSRMWGANPRENPSI